MLIEIPPHGMDDSVETRPFIVPIIDGMLCFDVLLFRVLHMAETSQLLIPFLPVLFRSTPSDNRRIGFHLWRYRFQLPNRPDLPDDFAGKGCTLLPLLSPWIGFIPDLLSGVGEEEVGVAFLLRIFILRVYT